MNQYHIYEAIGRGKDSTVYKGRKKKTIEYFAIKSVDKCQKSKVLQEVRILHALDHPNVLKFYSWYETSAHLWLVLEYCVGGDLLTLLQQDSKLPEDSIHDLAHDLVRALQFLHTKGIIYCDLKPSNILLDENGRTKLCDFGLARKLSDVSKTPTSLLPQAKRGTPFYMAPELFEDEGVHSFASDLWALGCVLFECYAGRPPFVGKEFTQLVKSILSDPTPPLPGNPSRSFVNLINSLLVKNPAERIEWSELYGHAFWKTKFTPLTLPPQPAFTNMIDRFCKPCLSDRNGDKPIQNKTPHKTYEKGIKGTPRQDENSSLPSRDRDTPTKGVVSGRKIQQKASGKAVDEKPKDTMTDTKGVNLLRLSRIAKFNLRRENEKENYRRPLPNSSDNNAEVEIENTDMELDFSENADDETQCENDGSDNSFIPEENLCAPDQPQEKTEDLEGTVSTDVQPSTNTAPDLSLTSNQENSLEHREVSATLTSVTPQMKCQKVKEISGPAHDSVTSKSSADLSQVLWHSTDLSVRPVMPSRKSDKGSEGLHSLPFDALPASDFVKMSKEQLESFNNKVTTILYGNNAISEKQNVIKYLETLSNNADAANILTNGPIMLILVKMLRQSKASALRVQLASLIGLLIRHSTFIEDELANSGILNSLTDGLRDRQEKVRRFSMAALGELLFYISTQDLHGKDNGIAESPSKDNRSLSGWQVSSALISLVSSVLQKGEDDTTQLYALRTIENISSQGGYWSSRFTSQDVISNLCYIFRAQGKHESMRLTAGSCLVRLVRFNPPTSQQVIEKLSFKEIAAALVKGSPREQQICLNLLITALLGSHTLTNIGRYLLPLVEEKNLVQNLLSLIDQGSEVLRGKTLVFVALLCKNGRRWLSHFFFNARLLSTVDRLLKEKDNFLQQCLDAFAQAVASIIPNLLDAIIGDVQQLMGKRNLQIASLTGRSSSKSNIHLFPVVLHLLGSSFFKRKVLSPEVLQHLVDLTKLVEMPFQGRDDFQITLLQVIESIAEEPTVIHQHPKVFIFNILPSLTILYKGNKDGDARFLCLKIFFDVVVIFLNELLEDERRQYDLESISHTYFLPLYPTLIEDEDPIPVYAQKLLIMLIEFKYIKIPDILHLKTISQCFEFLLGDLSTANVNSVMLCLTLASAPELETKILSQLKVVRKIGNLLEFVNAKEMQDFIEPTLSLCRAFLLRPASRKEGFVYMKEPTLLCDNSAEENRAVDQQHSIRDIADFGANVGVFLELSKSNDTNVADLASECVVLLLRAAPREATTGFLSNLPKVTEILESWQQCTSSLLVQRMLHSLGYSCRQYMLHAMILSISIPEISKLEMIVSALRSSGTPAVANAAFCVALELQRLPRCI